KIGPATWNNWTQERGLYFLGEKDPKYVDLVSMTDSFQDNPGEKLGSMVEARVGKGRWIYLGLGLWRQLPAGTDGAYQLLANLISLGKTPGVAVGLTSPAKEERHEPQSVFGAAGRAVARGRRAGVGRARAAAPGAVLHPAVVR